MALRSLEEGDLRSGVVLYRLCEAVRGRSLADDYGKLVPVPHVPPGAGAGARGGGGVGASAMGSLSNFYASFRFLRERFGLPDDDGGDGDGNGGGLGSEVRSSRSL